MRRLPSHLAAIVTLVASATAFTPAAGAAVRPDHARQAEPPPDGAPVVKDDGAAAKAKASTGTDRPGKEQSPPKAGGRADAPSAAALEESALSSDVSILIRLDRPFAEPMVFEDATAEEILKAVRAATGCTVAVDRRMVGDSGGWESTTVTCAPATPRAALDAVARAISGGRDDLAIDIAAGAVVFTDSIGRRNLRATHRYAIGGLLRRLPRAHDAPPTEDDYEAFNAFVQSISPDDWESAGGSLASVSYAGPVAAITATPAMHHEIRKALSDLTRELPAPTLDWSVRIVAFGLDVTDTEIAASTADQTALDDLVSKGRAVVLGAPRLLSPREQKASLSAETDGTRYSVDIEPFLGGALDCFAVRTTCVRPASAAVPACDASILLRATPGVRAIGVVELPSGGRGQRIGVEVLGLSEAEARKLRGPPQ